MDYRQVLQNYFGYTSLRDGQQSVIERVLESKNTLAVLPTGAGKSLCYQLPAMVFDGLTLVVSPLIALMRDQVQGLVQKGIPAARLDSSVDQESRDEILEQIQNKTIKLLYLSPEKFVEPAMMKLLKSVPISLVAIDEAHCISEWGHSFRSSYIKLPKFVRLLKPQSILALTATASPQVAQGIRKEFKILKRDHVQTSFFRKNLCYHVTACDNTAKRKRLLDVLTEKGRVPAIIYATRRGDVEELAAFLNQSGLRSRAYHAGMPAEARAEVQDDFVDHHCDVICATIAFGMGVDMPDIRSVIHFHPPKSPEGWIQESGRAGRDGQDSHCEVLLNRDDRLILEGMLQAKRPSKEAVQSILRNIFSQGTRAIVSRYNLSTLNDVATELLDILLVRLENSGWIKQDGASWMWCHLVPLRWDGSARKRLLYGFPKAQQEVFTEMLDSRQRTNLYELAEGDVVKMNRLVGKLRELEAGGDVKLKMSHSLKHYKICKEPESIVDLANDVLAVFEGHFENDMMRVDKVFQIAIGKRCLVSSLVGYFGEQLTEPCGRCASCHGDFRPKSLPSTSPVDVTMEELCLIQELMEEKRSALSSAERMARFLNGVYSPAIMRYRLYSHQLFGLLERLPYDDVLACTRAQMI